MHSYIKDKAGVFAVGDVVAMLASFIAAILVGHKADFSSSLVWHYRGGLLVLIVSTIVIFFILDLYSLRKLPDRFLHQIPITGLGLLLGSVVVTFIFFFQREPVPRAVFILFYFFSWFVIVLLRLIINRITASTILWKMLFVGKKEPSKALQQQIRERKYLRVQVVGYISTEQEMDGDAELPCLGGPESLLYVADREEIQNVVVTTSKMDEGLNELLLECMKRKIKISDFRFMKEDIAGKVPIEYLDDYWFILSLAHIDRRYFWYGKRFFDILASIFGLCVALPLLPIVAVLIKLDSQGPVFYSQDRVGRLGRLFRVWKLRTMVDGADKNNVHWTTDNDTRITRLGKLIRKTRLDELPQLFNILKGEMTLIGPRPEAESLVRMYEKAIPYYDERHMVTPGITGWAQINYPYGNSIEDTREKLKYDFFYVKHRSLVLDLVIFLRTIRIVLTGKGAL